MGLFLAIALSIFSLAWLYVVARLATSAQGIVLLSLPFVYTVIASFGLRGVLSKSSGLTARVALWANGLAMGWISFALALAASRDLILGPIVALGWIDAHSAFGPDSNRGVLIASVVALAWGVYGGVRGPRLREVEIEIAELPEALHGFSIAQISDLHVGPTIRERYVERVVERANSIGADVIALTGDIVDGPSSALALHAAPLANLTSREGTCFVPGNHEYYADVEAWFDVFRGHGARVLLNEGFSIDRDGARVWIGGVVDPSARIRGGEFAGPDLRASLGSGSTADLRILLAHQPNVGAEAAAELGYDVQLSGHTHGGQFFPWTLAIRKAQRFHQGRFRVGRLELYVTPGTGYWGPPVRLGTRTEIAKITFRPKAT